MTLGFNVFELITPKSSVAFLQDNSTVRQALEKLTYHKFSVIPILNTEGEYVGSLSEGDVLRFLASQNDLDKESCESFLIMDIERYRSYKSIKIDASFDEVYEVSLSQNFIPIVDDRNIFIGLVRRKEIMMYIKNKMDNVGR
jgi:CBS domain-containing protein